MIVLFIFIKNNNNTGLSIHLKNNFNINHLLKIISWPHSQFAKVNVSFLIPAAGTQGRKSSVISQSDTVMCESEAGEECSGVPEVEVSSSLSSGGEGDWWRKWELSKKPAKTMTYSREATPEGWNSKACAVAQRLKDSIDIDTVGIKENVTSSSHWSPSLQCWEAVV